MGYFRVYKSVIAALCFCVVACSTAVCADVAYIDMPSSLPFTRRQVEAAAKLYGLDLNVITLTSSSTVKAIAAIKNPKNVAVVLTPETLKIFGAAQILQALQSGGLRRPLMIVGITEQTDPMLLREWSGGSIDGCQKWTFQQDASYEVADQNQFTYQLRGAKLPLIGKEVRYLTLGDKDRAQGLITATDGIVRYPVFARTVVGGREIFFSSAPTAAGITIPADHFPAIFSALAPQILFLHYAAGDRGWHTPGHYANFTIDDPWLREPYGHVQYHYLLREMELHKFHTTIAFIPWNFDRSEPSLVSLFRTHPAMFSICIHGDNHDHQEFGPFDSKPLEGQINAIKQGLARMAMFSKLTGLDYDPVMIFPHKISPQETLMCLKRYNFAATVNADNLPSDVAAPPDPLFALRPATLAFANFPSLRRYSAEQPTQERNLAIDAFLGNPMFFYAHEAFFAAGIGAFDGLADKVNRLQPDTEWRSLGYIVRHLYLEKQRDDRNYDVQLLTSVVELTNNHGHDAVFFLEKEESGAIPFTVSVDGQPQLFELADGRLRLQVPVRDGISREVSIKYQNDLDLNHTDVSKTTLRITTIRYLSDFRDNAVSKSHAGRWFIRSYFAYKSDWNIGFITALLILVAICWHLRTSMKRRHPSVSTFVANRNERRTGKSLEAE